MLQFLEILSTHLPHVLLSILLPALFIIQCSSRSKNKASKRTSKKAIPKKAKLSVLAKPDEKKHVEAKDKKVEDDKKPETSKKEDAAVNVNQVAPAKDLSRDRMSNDNTLKEVPCKMPENDFSHTFDNHAEPVFSNDQLL
ncbi:hypothetical protein M3Y97_00143100 [Aphelenchoides bicaudatus]|nr:hypothetical protein M3Y97_00143100 [Aphelenchoides bicaudatus]